MNRIKTDIEGLLIFEPKIYTDKRGYFSSLFTQKFIDDNTGHTVFVQDNESKSGYGVLRGLHFQVPPYAQSKLVRVIKELYGM